MIQETVMVHDTVKKERTLSKDAAGKIGKSVVLFGWVAARRAHGKLIFIDLRDRWGAVQIVFNPKNNSVFEKAVKLRQEWVVRIAGLVKERPKGMENSELDTGKVEIEAAELEILSEAKTPPFALDTDGYEVGEELRLKYRYLDLRRGRLKKNLIMRSRVVRYFREYLYWKDFIEVATPTLTKSTPEGARDYVVPSRLHPGKFYALPQSPQQYKQLLMVSGLERYFQIGRCFRDEDTRGDRQPEFMQLDLEMSFVEEKEVLSFVEELIRSTVAGVFPQKKITAFPFPRLTYEEAMQKYGTDKPDLRKNKNDPDETAFVFITDFPMFEWKKTENRWDAVHHPFTKIKYAKSDFSGENEICAYLKSGPGKLKAHQYDLALNGYEIGGGSIREHNPKMLETVFEIMGHVPEEIRAKFGHLLEAFAYGVPPHGGVALGLERMLMIFAGEPNIREVIAFPKTGDGRDLMMDAPSELDEAQLKELRLSVQKQ